MNSERRNFLSYSGCSLLGYSSITNTILNLKLAGAAAADQSDVSDYKALVCLFLFGGNDSYNMLIPAEPDEYQRYQATRGNLAIPLSGTKNPALILPRPSVDGRKFAVHPAMSGMRDLYASGQLAFLANTGTLVEPTTVSSYKNRSSRVPSALFSHNDQRDQWQTGLPDTRSKSGWLGRAMDLLVSSEKESVFNAISLNGNNLIQTGHRSRPFTIRSDGSVAMQSDLASPLFELFRRSQLAGTSKQQSILYSDFSNTSKESIENNQRFLADFSSVNLPAVQYVDSTLSNSLDAAAKSIQVGKKRGYKRQTFFLLVPGWDNHQNLLEDHQLLLNDVSHSVSRFQTTLEKLGLSENVTTFSASDFARTLRSNGRGTDHAWGGNHFISGGAVNGGSVYGSYPSHLSLNDGLDIGKNGRLLPTTSCDEYFADLLRWFGVPRHSLTDVLPNLPNFSAKPLGFI